MAVLIAVNIAPEMAGPRLPAAKEIAISLLQHIRKTQSHRMTGVCTIPSSVHLQISRGKFVTIELSNLIQQHRVSS